MAGRDNRRNQMRGQGQDPQRSRYEQYGGGSQDESIEYRDLYSRPQGPDWGHESQSETQHRRYRSQQGSGQYATQGSSFARESQGGRWEPSEEGYGQQRVGSQYGQRGPQDSQGGGYGSQRSYGESQGGYGSQPGQGPQYGQGTHYAPGSQYGQSGPGYGQSGGYGAQPDFGTQGGYGAQQAGDRPHYGQRGLQFGSGNYGAQGGYGAPQAGYGPQQSSQEFGGQRESTWQRDYGSQQGGRGRFGAGSTSQQPAWGHPSAGSQGMSPSRSQRRGPKGWVRSDERIKEDLCERLADSELDASDVIVDVRQGVVTLEGNVFERWMRYSLEDLADGVSGVKDVQNNVRVSRGESASSAYGTETSSGGTPRTSGSSAAGSAGTSSGLAGSGAASTGAASNYTTSGRAKE